MGFKKRSIAIVGFLIFGAGCSAVPEVGSENAASTPINKPKAESTNTPIDERGETALPVKPTLEESRYVEALTPWLVSMNGLEWPYKQRPAPRQIKLFRENWEKVSQERSQWKKVPTRYKIADDWLLQGISHGKKALALEQQGKSSRAQSKFEEALDCFSTSSESLNIALRP